MVSIVKGERNLTDKPVVCCSLYKTHQRIENKGRLMARLKGIPYQSGTNCTIHKENLVSWLFVVGCSTEEECLATAF